MSLKSPISLATSQSVSITPALHSAMRAKQSPEANSVELANAKNLVVGISSDPDSKRGTTATDMAKF